MDEMIEITEGLIERGKSKRGGWNKHQLACLGVEWPPPKNWKHRVIGTKISRSSVAKFLAGRPIDSRQRSLFE